MATRGKATALDLPDFMKKPAILQPPDFTRKKRVPVEKPLSARVEVLPTEDQVPGEVQGHAVGSLEEGRVAVALTILGWDFEYQVPIMGGHLRRGGQVIDFLVRTHPLPTPLFIQGTYWHTGVHADPFDEIRLNASYAGWKYALVKKIKAEELPTITAAISKLRAVLPSM